ncbi:MAG TPA: site-2 protease family protein [Thermomicrobiaceae bacterium]|nr:site-2 protease family protein [Thermomicrobiaceae bacterium]
MFNLFNVKLDPATVAAILIAFVIGTTVHEFCHAWTALMLGDDTAQRQGRISLNPIVHFDPIGFLGMVMIAIGGIGIGWGRPVPVNPSRLRARQRGMALVAIAGPVSNVVLATVFELPLRFGNPSLSHFPMLLVQEMVWVNLLLASFNLIPIPPLDGHKILTGLLPDFWYPYLAPLERYGIVILIALILLGSITAPILTSLYAPVYGALRSVIVGA